MLTVHDVIEELKQLPQDYPVIISYMPIDRIYVDEEFYFGDSANPATSVGPAVIFE